MSAIHLSGELFDADISERYHHRPTRLVTTRDLRRPPHVPAPANGQIRAEPARARAFGGFVIDTPDNFAAAIATYVGEAPVEQVFIWASIAGMPEQMVADHVARIATRLKPPLEPLGRTTS